MLDALRYSAEITKQIMIPVFDKAIDFTQCIEFLKVFRSMELFFCPDDNYFDDKKPGYESNEALLYMRLSKREEVIGRIEHRLESIAGSLSEGWHVYTQAYYEEEKIKLEELKKLNPYKLPDVYTEGLEKLRARNTEILKAYGLDV